ncbi:MAG: hypothetical protein FJY37_02375 [Betaproteobacteria bacterium]|nr:hypothetical protein [Betaproteobacteria bacterium]
MRPKIIRDQHIAERIVFLDGLTGTGKTMTGPVMGSLERVELLRLEHTYEYLCALHDLGKLDHDAAASMLSMYADIACYNTMIARETNFRPKDLSGVFSNPGALTYLRRLLMKDGDAAMERIATERPILQVLTHNAMPVLRVAFDTFGDRLRVIEMVRHPLYLLQHGASYIERHGTDVRDFTVWIEYDGHALPWFAKGWEELWLASSSADKVIHSLDWIVRRGAETIAGLTPEAAARVLEVPFEGFVLDPETWVGRIAETIGTQRTPMTARAMRAQKVPRAMVAAGPDKEIYRRYTFKAPEAGVTERSEYDARYAWARANASTAALEMLDRMVTDYEAKWGRWF